MKISLNWMKRIVDFKKVYPNGELDVNEFASVLEKDGITVEKVTILPAGYKNLSENDAILDINVPKNRTDLLAQIWMAKEMCGIYKKSFKEFVTYIMRSPSNDWMQAELLETKLNLNSKTPLCKMLCGRILNNVTFNEMPQIMKDELIANDITISNDLNDYVNYNMRYFGQPLVALDVDLLPSKTIIASSNHESGALYSDGKKYSYKCDDPVLMSEKEVISVGGLLLNDKYKATTKTKNILLLSYVFDRDTSRNLSLYYDLKDLCSVLMSTGSSPQDVVRAVTTCAGMIYDNCTCESVEPQDIFNRFDMGRKSIMYTMDEINNILSTNLSFDDICGILSNPELNTSMTSDGMINTTFPSYRRDNSVNDIAQSIICYLGCYVIGQTKEKHED